MKFVFEFNEEKKVTLQELEITKIELKETVWIFTTDSDKQISVNPKGDVSYKSDMVAKFSQRDRVTNIFISVRKTESEVYDLVTGSIY